MREQKYQIDFSGYYTNEDGLSEDSGIYCVYACTPNFDEDTKKIKSVLIKRLLYIGESSDIRNRVKCHDRKDDWEQDLGEDEFLCFSYGKISASGNDHRKRCEAALIYSNQPLLNQEQTAEFTYPKTTIELSGKTSLLNPLKFTIAKS